MIAETDDFETTFRKIVVTKELRGIVSVLHHVLIGRVLRHTRHTQ